jgi:leader peptidase (prepilin peptidase)/N-methyltransferase
MIALLGSIFLFVTGTAVGSFLNVCIWRMPREQSIVKPPSHCPKCKHRLTPLELVPLLSFLWLGRRCRKCKTPISWRYFIVELVTGLVFAALWMACFQGDRLWDLPFYLIFASCLIAIFMIDLEHMIIPDELVIAAGAAAVIKALGEIFSLANSPHYGPEWRVPFPEFIAGAVVGAGFFIAVELFSRLLFRKEGMGGGDMKLGAAIGALLGPWSALLSFGISVAAGAVLGIFLIIGRLRKRVDYIPFGPFMVVSAFLLMLIPEPVWNWTTGAWNWWVSSWTPQ